MNTMQRRTLLARRACTNYTQYTVSTNYGHLSTYPAGALTTSNCSFQAQRQVNCDSSVTSVLTRGKMCHSRTSVFPFSLVHQRISANSRNILPFPGFIRVKGKTPTPKWHIFSRVLPAMNDVIIEGMTSEQLLLICASAVEQNDVGTVEQAVSALQKVSSITGEPSERVTAYFLQALLRRDRGSMLDPGFSSGAHELPTSHEVQWTERRWSLNELTRFVDFTPYFRFGYTAANGAMLEAFDGMEQIHILDFSTTHGMQWPTFIEALADRVEGPPNFRLTLSSAVVPTAPRLQTSYEEVGLRLAKYARLKNVPFQFHILPQPLSLLTHSDFNLRDGEALGVNFSLRLHYLADESLAPSQVEYGATAEPLCPRDQLMHLVRSLNPAIVTLYEEDCNTTSTDVVKRVEQSYAYEWMPFDFLATFWPPGHAERQEYEMNVGRKIENIVACEGANRLERLESRRQWLRRMARLRFKALPVGEEAVSQLQDIVDHHNTGWGMKHDEDDCTQSLLWKGNSLTFASAWIPSP